LTLEPGIERTDEFVVEDRLLTDVGGTIGASVLSTPGMIGMIERNAAILALEHLEEGKATVGFEICVKHVAAAAEGQTCTAHAKPSTDASCASRSRSRKATARSALAPTSAA
jgi:fluoroacetyl-CoA thioesterase